jgi:cobalamin biosynthesis protein CobT
VSLVLDVSGSMNGTKYDTAASILMAIASELDRLRVPFEVLSFNTEQDHSNDNIRRVPSNIYTVKTFEDPYRKILMNFVWHGGRNTNELPAIELASQHLALRKETKKVLFVLTDGCTEYGLDNVTRKALKQYVERIKRAGIKVVGFGICDDAVSHYCPEWIEVKDLTKFANELYGKLMKYLL